MKEFFLREALNEAQKGFAQGEVPIGAVLVYQGQIIARGFNTREADKNPLHHAEIKVLEEAARVLGDWRLNACELYVTLEPCPMCLGALFQARVGKLVFGCYDEKRDEAKPNGKAIFPNLKNLTELFSNNHVLPIQGGILEMESSQILKDFFKERRVIKP